MGKVIDEGTGQEPSCIFCKSKSDCSHLVAVIDRSFAGCNGGVLFQNIDNLRSLLTGIITGMVQAAGEFDESLVDYEIAAIFRKAFENHDSAYPDDIYIDDGLFLQWLVTALIDAGADEPPGYIVEEGGPGQSSALTLLYAENPKQVIQKVEEVLRDMSRAFNTSRLGINTDTDEAEALFTPLEYHAESIAGEALPIKKVADRKNPKKTMRPVLIVVTDWPGGTMAFKFGGAIRAALNLKDEKMTIVQKAPERIFRVETDVTEADFRKAMATTDVASGGSILFIEIPRN